MVEAGEFTHLDLHFADLMGRLAQKDIPELKLAAALASSYRRMGHICVHLPAVADAALPWGDGEQWWEKLRE